MATIKVRKSIHSTPPDVLGFTQAPLERVIVAYGVVSENDYTIGDTIEFPEIGGNHILSLTLVTADDPPVVVQAFNITDFTDPVPLNVSSGSAVDIFYRIDYIKSKGNSVNLSVLTS